MTSESELKFDESSPSQCNTVAGHGQYPDNNMEMQAPAAAEHGAHITQGIPAEIYGPNTVRTQCPSCHASILSEVRYESTTKTHIIALVLCILTCCCCIPYCIDSCKNANHHCPECGAYLGTYPI